MDPVLTPNQKAAIKSLAEMVTTNIISADPVGSLGEARELLASKRYDYAGAPIEYMEDLLRKRWPLPGRGQVKQGYNQLRGT